MSAGLRAVLARAALFFAILCLPIGSCTTLGLVFRAQASHDIGPVPPAALVDRARVPDDAYVAVVSAVALVARDEFPLERDWAASERGGAILALPQAPSVIGHCQGDDCPATGPAAAAVVLRGQICSADATSIACSPSSALRAYAMAEAVRRGVPLASLRLLLVGPTPSGRRREMWLAFAIAGALVVLWIGLVAFTSRRPAVAPRMVEERAFDAPLPGTELRAALGRLDAGQPLRLQSDEPGRVVFLLGRTEMQVRIWGIREPEHVPRRVVVTWKPDPYRGTQTTVRVEEAVGWLPLNPGPFADLCRGALAQTVAGIERALQPGG